jgi:hypothetical protein
MAGSIPEGFSPIPNRTETFATVLGTSLDKEHKQPSFLLNTTSVHSLADEC